MFHPTKTLISMLDRLLERLDPWMQSVLLAAARAYLVWVFFRSGLVKIQSWESTLTLFEYEYAVPLLPPGFAAWLATAGELTLPVLLALGLATRFSATGLFVINAVALVSYPDISPAGVREHVLWGWLTLMLAIFGGGRLALDRPVLRWARATS